MSGLAAAIDRVGTAERFGNARIEQAMAIRTLIGIVDVIEADVPDMSLVAALTEHTPARLIEYRRAVDTLRNLGTCKVDGRWLSGHAVLG